jgi:hypothetical protein
MIPARQLKSVLPSHSSLSHESKVFTLDPPIAERRTCVFRIRDERHFPGVRIANAQALPPALDWQSK